MIVENISGFATLWYERTEEAFIRTSYVQQQSFKRRKPFSLKDIQTPFYILYIGYFISFVVFLIEKFIFSPTKCEKIERFISPVDYLMREFELNRRKKFTHLHEQEHVKV